MLTLRKLCILIPPAVSGHVFFSTLVAVGASGFSQAVELTKALCVLLGVFSFATNNILEGRSCKSNLLIACFCLLGMHPPTIFTTLNTQFFDYRSFRHSMKNVHSVPEYLVFAFLRCIVKPSHVC
ncbi:hypothetical protein DM02DRAFT_233987 [Periconia macrospinosa]|uniref:Uncharacterized protein n=1 Tax=Periconia macrospinosa TaxID=97972 RepID=A0A2V1EBB1_9PLEO|nr:hypothetical protein DM02DRAFT_233987 [Periconia macrospinosa]